MPHTDASTKVLLQNVAEYVFVFVINHMRLTFSEELENLAATVI